MPRKRTVIQELQAIAEASKGLLKPQDVVAFAKNPKTRLHNCFEWDNSKAAHLYRIRQARELIRVTVRITDEVPEPIQAFVSLTSDRYNKDGGGYRDMRVVLSSAEMNAQLLQDAFDELGVFRLKYKGLKELTTIFTAVDRTTVKHKRNGVRKIAAA